VALGGGGYEPVQVVPRAWTHLIAEVAGTSVAGATPDAWREEAWERGRELAPSDLTDGVTPQWVPWEPADPLDGGADRLTRAVDASIEATREAVFPAYGLDVGL
jgi:acetoin utilization protein AcuC